MPRGIHMKGRRLSEETKHKISVNSPKIWLGKKFSISHRKKLSKYFKQHPISYWKGKKRPNLHTLEHKLKLRESMRGQNNPNWKGGKTPILKVLRTTSEYKLWRKAVFERDNYSCIWCKSNISGILEADHIKPFALFPELRFAIDNGRTLCKSCHRTTETYGNKISNK